MRCHDHRIRAVQACELKNSQKSASNTAIRRTPPRAPGKLVGEHHQTLKRRVLGAVVKNIVLCFDRARDHPGLRDATNAEALLRLLDESDQQITWYHSGAPAPRAAVAGRPALRWREAALRRARAGDRQGVLSFWSTAWEPGDRIFMFGVGRGAYCAQALTRLLGTVGVLPDDLMDYVLAAYALPRTRRTPQDWRRVRRLAARTGRATRNRRSRTVFGAVGHGEGARSATPADAEPLTNVVAGRHAVAIDGGHGPFGDHLVAAAKRRRRGLVPGRACDVAGGPGRAGRWPTSRSTGCSTARSGPASRCRPAAATTRRRPANSTRSPGAHARFRPALPPDPLVHASVDIYVREHPEYWRRLPGHVVWTDVDWVARSERLVHTEPARGPPNPRCSPRRRSE